MQTIYPKCTFVFKIICGSQKHALNVMNMSSLKIELTFQMTERYEKVFKILDNLNQNGKINR